MSNAELKHTRPDGTTETVTVTDATRLTLTLNDPGTHTLQVSGLAPGEVILMRRPAPVPLTPLEGPDEYSLANGYGLYRERLEWRDGDTVTPLADSGGVSAQPGEYAWNESYSGYVIPSLGQGGPWVVYELEAYTPPK